MLLLASRATALFRPARVVSVGASSAFLFVTDNNNRTMSSFPAWQVDKVEDGSFQGTEQTLSIDSLPHAENGVLIRVTHSSLNYKDALSASGNKGGVTRKFPHTPGIDAVGTLVESGEPCLVTGYDLGMNTAGGFGELIRVPSEWIVSPVPFAQPRTAMVYGTAGLTAGLCVQKLVENGKATPQDGPVVVTGATGAVGTVAVELLAKLGFDVVAISGKPDKKDLLLQLGAKEVCGRDALDATKKPLLKPIYAHGIDTVGGSPLAELLKQIQPGGSVACCGLVAGAQLETTVLPFILRGVQLLGVDSVEIPLDAKKAVWDKLATDWSCPQTEASAVDIGRHQLDPYLKAFLKGASSGKVVLDHSLTTTSSSNL
ncbi:Acrylyl-CoA reductase AcuI [Seminavis robusta]|uniref:Acrylyl-CoA reductase AcuI n=1 Tax=Seminavis robusta TaxID=568900 RepID=A0A9N8HD86_9STRA|nr:Acrylyl-CoA reductase AcuI [Seminavis robusta]|eukprot:Sro350_g123670.1 Acrylyl-CoA reductase AcuI (372) ;mRNA; f:16409-17524